MAKLPDITKLAEKFDIEKIVENVKSIISPGSVIPENAEGDPVAEKFVELRQLIQDVIKVQTEQTGKISKINNIVGALYKKLQEDGVITIGHEKEAEEKPKEKPKTETKPAEEKPSEEAPKAEKAEGPKEES